MSNEKEVSTVFSYKTPAIMITERYGDTEKVFEFTTADDYAAYKRIERDWLTSADKDGVNVSIEKTGEEKTEALVKIVKNAIDSAEIRRRRF